MLRQSLVAVFKTKSAHKSRCVSNILPHMARCQAPLFDFYLVLINRIFYVLANFLKQIMKFFVQWVRTIT